MNIEEIKDQLYTVFDELTFPRTTLIMFDEKINDLKEDLYSLEKSLEYTNLDYEHNLVKNMKKMVDDIEELMGCD